MKDLIINVLTKEVNEVEITSEEMIIRENDRIAQELENAKPKPPTIEEQLAEKDRQLTELKEKQFATNKTLAETSAAQQELLELLLEMGII